MINEPTTCSSVSKTTPPYSMARTARQRQLAAVGEDMQIEDTGEVVPILHHQLLAQLKRIPVHRRLSFVAWGRRPTDATPQLNAVLLLLHEGPHDLEHIAKVRLISKAALHELDLLPSLVESGSVEVVSQRVLKRIDGRERVPQRRVVACVLSYPRFRTVSYVEELVKELLVLFRKTCTTDLQHEALQRSQAHRVEAPCLGTLAEVHKGLGTPRVAEGLVKRTHMQSQGRVHILGDSISGGTSTVIGRHQDTRDFQQDAKLRLDGTVRCRSRLKRSRT